jgi:hypothetical protein
MEGFFGGPIYNAFNQVWKKPLVVESTGKIPVAAKIDAVQVSHLGTDINQVNKVC